MTGCSFFIEVEMTESVGELVFSALVVVAIDLERLNSSLSKVKIGVSFTVKLTSLSEAVSREGAGLEVKINGYLT